MKNPKGAAMWPLKVMDWNVGVTNTRIDQIIIKLQTSEWHICCLQEVSDDLLARLKRLEQITPPVWRVCDVKESDRRMLTGEVMPCNSVILVRKPLELLSFCAREFSESSPQHIRTRLLM